MLCDGNPFAKKLISNYDYFGIDISNHLIKIAKNNYGKNKFKVVDAEKINIKDKFDMIICFHSLWYLPSYLKSIKKMSKILTPNGCLIFDSLNKIIKAILKITKIVYETRGQVKLKEFLKIFWIIFRVGYTKWSDVVHHKLNDIQKINNIINNQKIFRKVSLLAKLIIKKK